MRVAGLLFVGIVLIVAACSVLGRPGKQYGGDLEAAAGKFQSKLLFITELLNSI